jgi:Mn-dependent DtxR family transcriptional regulator
MGALATRQFFDTNVGSYLPMSRAGFEFGPDAAAKVRHWRSLRASWQAIADMFGCTEDKVRRQYDATYVPPHVTSTVAQAAVAAQTVMRVAIGGFQHEILKLLAHGAKSYLDLARALDVRIADVDRAVLGLTSKGMVAPFGQDALQLTAHGLAELDRIRDVANRREPDARMESARDARRRRVLLAVFDGFDTTAAIARRIGVSSVTTKSVLNGLSAAGEVAGHQPSRGPRRALGPDPARPGRRQGGSGSLPWLRSASRLN